MHLVADIPAPQIIGRSVQAAMVAQDRAETELAIMLGVSMPAVRRRLRGASSWDATEVYAVSRWLGLPIDDVMSGRLLAGLLPSSDRTPQAA